jgi:hypothetical protein
VVRCSCTPHIGFGYPVLTCVSQYILIAIVQFYYIRRIVKCNWSYRNNINICAKYLRSHANRPLRACLVGMDMLYFPGKVIGHFQVIEIAHAYQGTVYLSQFGGSDEYRSHKRCANRHTPAAYSAYHR